MMNRTEAIAMIIRYFNMQAGTACRTNNEANQRYVSRILNEDMTNIQAIKEHIRAWAKEHPDANKTQNCLTACIDSFIFEKKEFEKKAEPQPQAPAPQVTEQAVGSAMGILEQAVVGLIAKTQAERIESEIMGSVQDTVRAFIKSEYGTIERKVNTVINGRERPSQGIIHEKFDTVLKFVANNEPVFLTGPAGSGKNVLCKQIADALGLKFYFTNAVTQEYKLTGFTDAMGTYQETQFYKAFTQGGVFMLDEMDASIPEVLVILNAAIANRYFDFPAPIGYVEAHPDFRVIAAGNTTGHGADYEYVGRNQLDAASLDRFAVVQIGYSETIENSVAGDTELAQFCRDFRESAKNAGVQVIVSYRAIGRLAKMLQLLTVREALETCLIKGMEKDDIHMISQGIRGNNKYANTLREMAA